MHPLWMRDAACRPVDLKTFVEFIVAGKFRDAPIPEEKTERRMEGEER